MKEIEEKFVKMSGSNHQFGLNSPNNCGKKSFGNTKSKSLIPILVNIVSKKWFLKWSVIEATKTRFMDIIQLNVVIKILSQDHTKDHTKRPVPKENHFTKVDKL